MDNATTHPEPGAPQPEHRTGADRLHQLPRAREAPPSERLHDGPPAVVGPLRGRDHEWRQVEHLLSTGDAAVLLVEGRPGMGMSRLLADTHAAGTRQGFSLLCGRWDEFGRFGSDGVIGAHALEEWVRRVETSAAEDAVLATLDDLQWADASTLAMLRTLPARRTPRPICWVFARRIERADIETGRLFADLEREGADRITLDRLTSDAVTRLCEDILDVSPTQDLRAFVDAAAGNPGLIVELVGSLLDAQAILITGDSGQLLSTRPSPQVQDALRRRLDQLSPRARLLLDSAAALRHTASLERAASLLGESPERLAQALHELTTEDLLTVHQDTMMVRHELVRQTIMNAIPSSVRHALLRRAAQLAQPNQAGAADDPATALRTALLAAHALGALAPEAVAASLRSRMHLRAGRFDDAVVEAEIGISDAAELERALLVPAALTTLATVAIRRGDLAAAAEYIHRLQTDPEATDVRSEWIAGLLVEAEQGAGPGLQALTRIYDTEACRELLAQETSAAASLVRTALAARDHERAQTVVTTAEQVADQHPELPAVVADAMHARGLLDESNELLLTAATKHPDPWARASAAEDLGVLLAAQAAPVPDPDVPPEATDHGRAIAALEEALEEYDARGASRDAARVRRRLRRLGVRRRHWNRADRSVSGWDSLTDAERGVADLVAEGLTNRQVAERLFVSPHTVAFHLRHVYRKLEIMSRSALIQLAAGQPRPPDRD